MISDQTLSVRWHFIGICLYILIFLLALFALHHLLAEVRLQEITLQFRSTSWNAILTGIFLVACNYFVLTGYDVLALNYIDKAVPYLKTALTSFVSYTISHNIGLSFLTGGSVRYRIYSTVGLSAVDIAILIIFCGFTFWLGAIAMMGLAFLLEPGVLLFKGNSSQSVNYAIGVLLLILICAYVLLTVFYHKPVRFRHWTIHLPNWKISFQQLSLSMLDITLAAGVLYVLLPADSPVSFIVLLTIYLAAIALGSLSHVPGGLGVFEAIMLLGLPQLNKEVLLGALLMYRCLYYLLPLLMGMLLLGAHEIGHQWGVTSKLSKSILAMGRMVMPRLIGTAVLIGGAVLLFSGATPAMEDRLSAIKIILPLPFVETSHLLASVIGLWLLILSRGIFLRLDSAWFLTILVLMAGIVLSLMKGLDYEEAFVLLFILAGLLMNKSAFYRKGSLLNQAFTPGTLLIITVIVSGSIWLGLFSYKHIEYSDVLWWQFAYYGDTPRFLRASFTVIILTLSWFTYLMVRPAEPFNAKGKLDMDIVKKVIKASSSSKANIALTGDKRFLVSEDKTAFIMYAVQGRSWITMGDPCGPETVWPELLQNFRQMADMHAGWPVFYQADASALPFYLDQGLSIFKIGEEAIVILDNFKLDGSCNSSLRYINRKLVRHGCKFDVINSAECHELIPELRQISDSWMALKSTSEKGFSVGSFDPEYLAQFDIAIVKYNQKVIAFANLWQTADRSELSIDLMRYLPEAPNGTMDYLFLQIMLWGQTRGYHRFNLGMAPLAGLQNHPLAPIWMKAGVVIYRYGEHFYNFEGLRGYKEKFNPVWEPKYIACPGGIRLPGILLDITSLIAGGATKVLSK